MGGLNPPARVLVTGATGFLGSHVVDRLLADEVSVLAVGRDAAKCAALKAKGCDVLVHDISTPFGAIEGPAVEAIVHCAALSAPFGRLRDFVSANVDGTTHVIQLAQRLGVQNLVHVSTPSVYFSFCDQIDTAETSPIPPPVNAYAKTKFIAENLVQDAQDINAIILRPRGIYGPRDVSLLPRVLKAAQRRPLPLLRDGRARIDLTYVGDVVDAIMASLNADLPHGEVFNISGGEVLPIRHIVDQACQMAGITARWRKVPLPLAMGFAGALETLSQCRPNPREPLITRYGLGLFAYAQSLNISKAERTLNWSPKISFADGLARTFEDRS